MPAVAVASSSSLAISSSVYFPFPLITHFLTILSSAISAITSSMHCCMLSSERAAVTLGERVERSASAAASLQLPEMSSQPSSENTHSSPWCSSTNQASTSSTLGHFLPFPLALAILSLLAPLSFLPACRFLRARACSHGLSQLLPQRSPCCAPVDKFLRPHAETFIILLPH